jgi:hypothetical protein
VIVRWWKGAGGSLVLKVLPGLPPGDHLKGKAGASALCFCPLEGQIQALL